MGVARGVCVYIYIYVYMCVYVYVYMYVYVNVYVRVVLVGYLPVRLCRKAESLWKVSADLL